ncbi:Pyridoxal-phosphate dependent enzyme [uncultured archaeon]|nr:Pyridoxal-phosphate dependent enzyme [uncultured archaeon]
MRIIEATSGNTGISFAMIAAARGYRFTAVMPGGMTPERGQMITAFGGDIILTPAKEDMAGTMKKFEQLKRTAKNAWFPQQFENPDNVSAHVKTGNEILRELGRVDAFVAGVGTGGTLMGVAKALRKKNKHVKIIAVEPAESAVMSGGKAGRHDIQGIGEGFVPQLMDYDLIDEIIRVKSGDAKAMTRRIAREEGMLCGISSGANVLAALQIGCGRGFRGKNVVTVLCDRGERYLSTGIFK